MRILIDDNRNPENYGSDVKVARTYAEGMEELRTGLWEELYLDYDLGEGIGRSGFNILINSRSQDLPNKIKLISSSESAIGFMGEWLRINGYEEHLANWWGVI